jgi:hypothetical protein
MAPDSIIVFQIPPAPPKKKQLYRAFGHNPKPKIYNFGNVNFTTTIPLQEAHNSCNVKTN